MKPLLVLMLLLMLTGCKADDQYTRPEVKQLTLILKECTHRCYEMVQIRDHLCISTGSGLWCEYINPDLEAMPYDETK